MKIFTKLTAAMLIAAAATGFASCGSDDEPEQPDVWASSYAVSFQLSQDVLNTADVTANIALPDGTFREEKVTQTNPSWNLAGNTLPNKAGVIITFVPKQNIDASKTYSIAIKGSISTSSYKNQVLVKSKTSGVKSDMSVAGNNLAQYYVGKGIGLASGVSATGAIEEVNAGDFDFGLNGVWEWLAGVLTGEEDK